MLLHEPHKPKCEGIFRVADFKGLWVSSNAINEMTILMDKNNIVLAYQAPPLRRLGENVRFVPEIVPLLP